LLAPAAREPVKDTVPAVITPLLKDAPGVPAGQ